MGFVLIQDVALSVFSSLLAILLVRWLSEPVPGFTMVVVKWLAVSVVFSVLGILASGSHKMVRRWSTVKSTTRIIGAMVVKEILLVIAVAIAFVQFSDDTQNVLLIFADAMFTSVLWLYVRLAARIFSNPESGNVVEVVSRKNALVSGADDAAVNLASEISSKGEYNVVGFITPDKSLAGRMIGDRKVYLCASAEDLKALEWKLGGIDCVFMSNGNSGFGGDDAEGDSNTAADAAPSPEPDSRTAVDHFVKRAFDVCLSGILILVFFPLAAVIALAIYIEDGLPFLYKQERVGLNGETFTILKFRSMRVDAEKYGAQLFAGDDDPRLTKVGRFIRAHHLDELPQLLNVFIGDMSFVGYRPERPFYIGKIMEQNPRYRYLYQIRPGVTSYATLYNGYTDTMEKMLKRLDLDLYYLRHHSVMFDMKVLGLTFLSIVSGKKF